MPRVDLLKQGLSDRKTHSSILNKRQAIIQVKESFTLNFLISSMNLTKLSRLISPQYKIERNEKPENN